MRIPIRYFSIGLLTASIVLLIMFLITDDSGQNIDELSVEELAGALEDKGYRTISQDDFISYSVYLDEQQAANEEEKKDDKQDQKKDEEEKEASDKAEKKDKDKDKESEEKEKDEEEKEEERTSATITVKQGFVSQDIGEALKDAKIIDDVDEFVKYMEDNGYSSYIQIGKFKVNSDMSLKKLAETLTTYPGS